MSQSETKGMQYRRLGQTGLKVSPLCLGTMMFGEWGRTTRDESTRMIHRALDHGINFIDTANVYSGGESEEIVGHALQGRRDQVVLATKVWGAMGEGPNQRGLSRKAISEEVENSLRRLRTDCIDLYQIHRWDPETPWEETLSALTDLVRQGKVRYLGCSTNHYRDENSIWGNLLEAWRMAETLWISERHGLERFVCLQPPYSMLRRSMEAEHFPACQHFGMGCIVWSPLEGGWLTGKYRREQGNPKDSNRAENWVGDLEDPKFQRRLDVVEQLLPLAEELGLPLAELAVAWTLRHPAVTSTIIGPRTMEQLDSNVRALEAHIGESTAARIDELVPPGRSVL